MKRLLLFLFIFVFSIAGFSQFYWGGFSYLSSFNYYTLYSSLTLLQPSSHSGMGAIPYSGGVAFRVWAPNADKVAVAGSFNGWSTNANFLASEGNGYWSVDVNGASVGDQYLFVIYRGSSMLWRRDPYARDLVNSIGNCYVRNRSYSWSSFSPPAWNEMVIYELHIKTFNGTFNGLAAKASYLKNTLGVNAVEIMPVGEFAGDYNWGYGPGHIFAPESSYGGYASFKNMVNTLHQNGIAVIMDVVYNHWGPSDNTYWIYDGVSYGKGGIYFYTDYRHDSPWGPRPDYGRGEVRQYIRDNALYWLTEMNCDGLRWDSTICIRKTHYNSSGVDIPDGWSLMQWVNNEINSQKPGAISIAEDLQNNAWITKTTGSGGAGFDSQWSGYFVHNIRDQAKKTYDSWRDMNVIKNCIQYKDNGDQTKLVKYSESHDECGNGHSRLNVEIDGGGAGNSYWAKKRAGLAGLTAIFSIGIPMLFQGQEFLEDGWFDDHDDLDWSKATTYAGYVQMYRDAIRLKRNWYNNTRGLKGNNINVYHVNNSAKVIAFHRWYYGGPGDDVVIIMNWSNNTYSNYKVGMPRGGTWYCRYNSDWNGYDSSFGNYGGYNSYAYSGSWDGMSYNMTISIGKYAVLVYSQ